MSIKSFANSRISNPFQSIAKSPALPSGTTLYTGWMKPSSFPNDGIITSDRRVFSADTPGARGYAGTILNKVFAGDFTVIASWKHDYIGVGMVWKNGASLSDFTGSSADSAGIYWGSLNVSGFPTNANYGFLGQYHAPISGAGQTSVDTKYWFKWQRSGNTLTLQYATSGPSGPWTNFNTNFQATCNTSDQVIIGAGEASGGENDPLKLISVTGS